MEDVILHCLPFCYSETCKILICHTYEHFYISFILGETGIGKSTLIDSLFNTSFDDRMSTHFQPNVRLKAETYELHESNVRLKLTIVNTVGFGDQINKHDRLVAYSNNLPNYDIIFLFMCYFST